MLYRVEDGWTEELEREYQKWLLENKEEVRR